jgi:hypothetical protein
MAGIPVPKEWRQFHIFQVFCRGPEDLTNIWNSSILGIIGGGEGQQVIGRGGGGLEGVGNKKGRGSSGGGGGGVIRWVRAMWSIGSFTCRGSSLTPARSQGDIKSKN